MNFENTNKAIAYNSAILYLKMAITTVCALLTTRFALQALGVIDYGLYAVLGGIISFISILNTIMLATSNRFIAVAIGKGNLEEANKQFNVNLVIHVAIAVLALLVAVPIGEWYIPRFVNYEGPLSNAMMVYYISIIGSIISFIGVPYNGLMMAKEQFLVFSLADIFLHFGKMIISWLLIYYFSQKLLIYTVTMSILTAMTAAIYLVYCSIKYRDIVRIKLVKDKSMYKEVFNFSAWVSIGAIAHVGKNQGAAVIVNAFFNTVMNSAMGVASSVNAYVLMFAQNVSQPIAPQITKSYAKGNIIRTDELLIMSTKYTFMLMFLVGSIFLVAPDWILGLWLVDVPAYSSLFLILFIIDNLVQALNSGVGNLVFASGKISLYQILVSVLNVLSVIIGFLVLRSGADAYYLLVVYIAMSVLRFFVVQWVLHVSLNYNTRNLWIHSYLPSFLIVVLFVPAFFIPYSIPSLIRVIMSLLYLCVLEWFIGFNKEERNKVLIFVTEKLK